MGNITAVSLRSKLSPGRHHDGDGLMLVVSPRNGRSWIVRVQANGVRKDYGLGSAKFVSLAEAREKARAVRACVWSGEDPKSRQRLEKRRQLEVPTFREASLKTHEEQKSTWRNEKHRADWLSSLERYAFPQIGNLRIDEIDAPTVRDVLLPIWLSKPETARRLSQRLKGVLDWAAANGLREQLDLTGVKRGLPRQPVVERHFAALPFADVPKFIETVLIQPETPSRLALIFTILTAARSGEVRGARWDEIDLEKRIWTVPADRMKANRVHTAPLSDGAMEILQRAKRWSDSAGRGHIFTGTNGGQLSDMTLSKIIRSMKVPATVHGFRSSFKDWASETTEFPDAVSEAALAHKDADKVRAAYRRTDFLAMRTDLMARWSSFVIPSLTLGEM